MTVAIVLSLLALGAATTQTPLGTSSTPEDDYRFLSVTSGPCVRQIGRQIDPKQQLECRRMTEPRRYRGTWYVAFETSLFTPVGNQNCVETKGQTKCAELEGASLPWPSRGACARKFEVEFIGRRNVEPGAYPVYRIVVDEMISAKRLSDPPNEIGDCDPAAS